VVRPDSKIDENWERKLREKKQNRIWERWREKEIRKKKRRIGGGGGGGLGAFFFFIAVSAIVSIFFFHI